MPFTALKVTERLEDPRGGAGAFNVKHFASVFPSMDSTSKPKFTIACRNKAHYCKDPFTLTLNPTPQPLTFTTLTDIHFVGEAAHPEQAAERGQGAVSAADHGLQAQRGGGHGVKELRVGVAVRVAAALAAVHGLAHAQPEHQVHQLLAARHGCQAVVYRPQHLCRIAHLPCMKYLAQLSANLHTITHGATWRVSDSAGDDTSLLRATQYHNSPGQVCQREWTCK